MTNSVSIRIEIQCPHCFQASLVDELRIPEKQMKVRCNRCKARFLIDRTSHMNCKLRQSTKPARQPLTFDSQTMEWIVEHRSCKGIRYDLKGLGVLIRAGLINKRTMIRPPGSPVAFRTSHLTQLRAFFVEEEKVDLSISLEDKTPSTSNKTKAWYELDCSDFFENKLLPYLTKDLRTSRRNAS